MVHRVIAGRAPGVPVIDITHQIPAYDVRAGALAFSLPALGAGQFDRGGDGAEEGGGGK